MPVDFWPLLLAVALMGTLIVTAVVAIMDDVLLRRTDSRMNRQQLFRPTHAVVTNDGEVFLAGYIVQPADFATSGTNDQDRFTVVPLGLMTGHEIPAALPGSSPRQTAGAGSPR